MAFSLLANSSLELDGNQEMELTIRSLSILIRPSGSSCLSDALSKVCNVNKAYALEHMNVVFSLVATAHLPP
jgi:hypothetical protein